jgi:hypothetical protein
MFREGDSILLIGTHVDDLFLFFNTGGKIIKEKVFEHLSKKMEVDNKGKLNFALDTKIERNNEKGTLKISQTKFIENLVKNYEDQTRIFETPASLIEITEEDLPRNTQEAKQLEKIPFQSLIGSLWWLAQISRPDIFCALHKCAVWQNRPSVKLWHALMRIVGYLKGTKQKGTIFLRPKQFFGKGWKECTETLDCEREGEIVKAYCDASFASETKFRSRFGFFFVVLGGCVSWSSSLLTRLVTSHRS